MKTNSKNHPIFTYLINQLPTVEEIANEYGPEVEDTIQARLNFVVKTFEKEFCFGYNLKYYGSKTATLKNWFQGLPSVYSIEYRNHAILEIARETGALKPNATEAQEQKILNNWFNFAALKFTQLCKFNKVEF
jgi:hypothetical protein